MIIWLSIPIPVPTLGMVAWWLVIGNLVMVWNCVGATRYAWRKCIAKDTPVPKVSNRILIVPLIWPVFVFAWLYDLIPNKTETYTESWRTDI